MALLYDGIFPLPLAMVASSCSSVCFCTVSLRRSPAFSDFPVGVLPLPSAPWQVMQAFPL